MAQRHGLDSLVPGMGQQATPTGGRPPSIRHTPLRIIALFVALTEVVLGAAATQTTGNVQWFLAVFVVVFPFLVAGAFFAILWDRPEHFYPPTEYGSGTDVGQFVGALRRHQVAASPQLFDEIQAAIHSALTSPEIIRQVVQSLPSGTEREQAAQADTVTRALTSAADQAVERIREQEFFVVDATPLVLAYRKEGSYPIELDPWALPYNETYTFEALLFVIPTFLENRYSDYLKDNQPKFGFDNYGKHWLLRNKNTGQLIEAESVDKNRPLSSLGITPGSFLEVVPVE